MKNVNEICGTRLGKWLVMPVVWPAVVRFCPYESDTELERLHMGRHVGCHHKVGLLRGGASTVPVLVITAKSQIER